MKTILAASLMLFTAGLMAPVSGYHIDPTPVGGGLAVSDWVSNAGVQACESLGAGDDRIPSSNAAPGNGGLCMAGRNDATGTLEPNIAGVPAMPASGTWTRLDLCDALTLARTNAGGVVTGACSSAASGSLSALSLGTAGRTDAHGYLARVGAFTCGVPTNRAPMASVNRDYALYYQEKYAWWSFDGDGTAYTGNDPIPGAHTGDGLNPPGTNYVATAFHGHVSVFPDLAVSEPGASVVGSVETDATGFPAGLTLADDSTNSPYGVSNNCGGSPSCAPSTATCAVPYGPVVRAPNAANTGTSNPVPLCAQTWDGFVVLTYSCLNVINAACTVTPVAVAVTGVSLDTTVPGGTGTLAGGLDCTGVVNVSATAVVAPSPFGIGVGANAATGSATGTQPKCVRSAGALGGTFGNLPSNIWAIVCQPSA